MGIRTTEDWIFFTNENYKYLDTFKMGKWMVYFSKSSREYITEMCEKAVNENVVPEAKVAIKGDVACFYLNIDEIEYHRKCINFMIENNLIRKTKTGRYYNISFKKDMQTFRGEYGSKFISQLKLEDFINLGTGEWTFRDHTIEVGFDEYCNYYLEKLKDVHNSYLEKIERSSGLLDEDKKNLISWECKEYNGEINLCQLCQNTYKRFCELGITEITVLIPDGLGDVMFASTCTEKPIKLLREQYGKKRCSKKVSAVKLRKKMKQSCKSVHDINEITKIKLSSLEKYVSKDSTISILNILLIASVLKCSLEELTE